MDVTKSTVLVCYHKPPRVLHTLVLDTGKNALLEPRLFRFNIVVPTFDLFFNIIPILDSLPPVIIAVSNRVAK